MGFRKTSALAAAGAVAILAAGTATSASAAPMTSDAVAATCHASSGNLYCGNKVNASIYKSPRYDTASGNPIEIVDTLRSGFSYFQCYTIGQPHRGGNSIWYRTYGDDTGAWGYVPAIDVWTPQDPFPGVNFC